MCHGSAFVRGAGFVACGQEEGGGGGFVRVPVYRCEYRFVDCLVGGMGAGHLVWNSLHLFLVASDPGHSDPGDHDAKGVEFCVGHERTCSGDARVY